MECMRCDGRMIEEQYITIRSDSVRFQGWRCLNCGDVMDAVIHQHRRLTKGGHRLVDKGSTVSS